MQNISKTFARELRRVARDQRKIKKLQNNLDEFKNKYRDILGEGEHYKLDSGEQFR